MKSKTNEKCENKKFQTHFARLFNDYIETWKLKEELFPFMICFISSRQGKEKPMKLRRIFQNNIREKMATVLS